MDSGAFQPDWLSRPGSTMSTLMARRGMDASALASLMGRDRQLIQRLLAGSAAISPEIAISLSRHLGGSPGFWSARQEQFDRALDDAASKVPNERAKEWLRELPLQELLAAGWIAHSRGREALRSTLAYFGVSDPDDWTARYKQFANSFSYRSSPTYDSKLGALAAWLRHAEIEAEGLACAAWNRDRLLAILPELRGLTKLKRPAAFMPKLRALCASAGVAVVFVKAPSGCRASGATRFVTAEKAVLALSFRHLSDDHFWFTLFHEIGHLLLHGRESTFVDGGAASCSEREEEANNFSASVLIPPDRVQSLHSVRGSAQSIIRFAVSIDIAPGIVVGQMQHHHLLGPAQMNGLKRRYQWDDIVSALG